MRLFSDISVLILLKIFFYLLDLFLFKFLLCFLFLFRWLFGQLFRWLFVAAFFFSCWRRCRWSHKRHMLIRIFRISLWRCLKMRSRLHRRSLTLWGIWWCYFFCTILIAIFNRAIYKFTRLRVPQHAHSFSSHSLAYNSSFRFMLMIRRA